VRAKGPGAPGRRSRSGRGSGCSIGLTVPSRRRPHVPAADVVAGVSVALVAIPQALAYAELAGIPAIHGLLAAAIAPLAAVAFASSPALQTGPTAMSAVLVLAVLSPMLVPFTAPYAGAAALLALLVGVVRVALGLTR
jgi:sulfate permease, SulP family